MPTPPKPISLSDEAMSAFGGKADVTRTCFKCPLIPEADISGSASESPHIQVAFVRPRPRPDSDERDETNQQQQ